MYITMGGIHYSHGQRIQRLVVAVILHDFSGHRVMKLSLLIDSNNDENENHFQVHIIN